MTLYIWLFASIALLVAELLTGTFYLLVLAAAVFLGALLTIICDSTLICLMATAVFMVIGFILLSLTKKKTSAKDASKELQNIDIGQIVKVEQWKDKKTRVFYRGTFWEAVPIKNAQPAPGEWIIDSLQGNRLVLKPLS